jgi:hypothetical protein
MTHEEMIAVIQAHKEKKQIELRIKNFSNEWIPTTDPTWDFNKCDFRIKPEQKQYWAKPEDVPLWVYVYRKNYQDGLTRGYIHFINDVGIYVNDDEYITWESIHYYAFYNPHTKTWEEPTL